MVVFILPYFEVQLPIADQDVKFTGLSFNGLEIQKDNQLDVTFNIGDDVFNGKIIRAEAEVDPKTRMLSVVANISENKNNNLIQILASKL